MRVMVLVKATAASESGDMPPPWRDAMMAAMARFNAELRDAGILLAAEGLKPSAEGCRLALDGASRTVVAGPFPLSSELVAGYWLWQVRDMEEALAWARRCPNPMPGPSEIELRPLFEPGGPA
jgi:hypothetical protein